MTTNEPTFSSGVPRRTRRPGLVVALACLATSAQLLALAPTARSAPEPVAEDPGLVLVREERLSDRLVELTFRTPALEADTKVRVLLPTGYDAVGESRYPVLYLLQGGADDHTSWTRPGSGDAVRLTAGLPLITVMPAAGKGGWYTDWYNNGAFGTPQWETYHLEQLVPWIDAHYRTVADREGRAIAGLSMGGFGAMSYAARHPDRFVAAASFSGAVDTNVPTVAGAHIIDLLAAQDGGIPGSLWGLREVEEVRWRGDNPWDLAENLRGLSVTLRSGNGDAGGDFGGGGPTDPIGFALERSVYEESLSLHQRLDQLGIDHTWDDYGAGTHSWPYWNRGLRQTLPAMMAAFADPPPPPSPFTFTAIEPAYAVYGWKVTLDRGPLEFSTLADADESGFSLTGSGSATVTTGPIYTPRRLYTISQRGSLGATEWHERADRQGRLLIRVALGPSNVVQQQFTPDGGSPATSAFTTTTEISPTRPGHWPTGRPERPTPR